MGKIAIITPTVREDGLPLVEKAIKRQTHKDFVWCIVSPFTPTVSIAHTWIKEPTKDKNDVWALNKAYNKVLKCIRCDLNISWQDHTYAKPDTVERFYNHFLSEPKTLVTAVGNKYTNDSFSVMSWKDPREREDQGTYYECYFNDIEANLCSIPYQAIADVGGFDESLDRYYGMDFYSVADRINMLGGYNFKIDQTIKSYSVGHDRFDNWEELNAIHGPYEDKRK